MREAPFLIFEEARSRVDRRKLGGLQGWSASLTCIILCLAMLSGCGGSASAPYVLRATNVSSVKLVKLATIPHTSGLIKGVNDQPRRRNTPNFLRRVSAAHARGVWLTDELNMHRGAPNPRSSYILKATNIELHQANGGGQRAISSTLNACGTCDPSGGGSGTESITTFGDNGGDYSYDTEVDFSDGTSMLFEEFTDNSNDQILTSLDPDGSYTEYAYESTFSSTPAPQPTMQQCMTEMDGSGVFYIQCGSQTFNPIPKWACPYISMAGGLAAKWTAAAATKNGKAGDVVGGAVGISLNQWCNATAISQRRRLNRAG